MIWLACHNQNAYAVANVVATVAKTEKSISPEHLGLYAGTFDPTNEYTKTKIAFDKWDEINNEAGEGYANISDVPKQFRSYMYKDPLYGVYYFISPNRISIVIDEINNNGTFKAHSIAAGNLRPILGTWTKENQTLHLMGKEPGDNLTDGTFDVLLNTDINQIDGVWKPNNIKAQSKKLNLVKTVFKYDPELGDKAIDLGRAQFSKNPSTQMLLSKDVENLTQPQIRIISSLILARHGYSFANQDVRRTFEYQDWYIPRSNDVKAELTEVEKKNLLLLKQYSQYADKHYDNFGR